MIDDIRYDVSSAANRQAARLEPRARYPDTGVAKLRKRRPKNLRLRLARPEGAPHLPVVRLDAA